MQAKRQAAINVKALIILCVVGVVLSGAAFAGWKIRKRMIADNAKKAGDAAWNVGNYKEAARNYRLYVERYPDKSPDILKRYAEANLKVVPIEANNVGQAIAAYRRLLRVENQDTPENFRTVVELYFQVGEFGEAGVIAERWLAKEQADAGDSLDAACVGIPAAVWHARCLIAQRSFASARGKLEAIATSRDDGCAVPDGLEAHLLLAELERIEAEGNREWRNAAIARYAAALERFPDSARALALLARTRRERGIVNGDPDDPPVDAESAPPFLSDTPEENLINATAMNSDDPSVRLVLFAEWLDRGNGEQSRKQLDAMWDTDAATLEKYTIRNTEQWRMFLYRAETEWAQLTGDTVRVAPKVEEALKDLPARQRTLFLPAAVQFFVAAGQAERADKLLTEYEAKLPEVRDPNDDDRLAIQLTRARIALIRNDPYGAINGLQNFLTRRPNDTDALRLLIAAYERTGQDGRRAEALEQYARVVPTDLAATVQLARRRLIQGDPQMAFALADRVPAGGPLAGEASVIKFQAGAMAAAQGAATNPGGAARPGTGADPRVAQLAELATQFPKRTDIRIMQAAVEPDRAIAILSAAIEECDRPVEAYIQLARIHGSDERMDEAVTLLEEAVTRITDAPGLWIALSEFQERSGNADAARASLDRARDAFPDAPDARRSIAFARAALEFRADDRDAAIEAVTKHLAEDSKERPADVATREYLLNVPEIRDDAARAGELVAQIKAIEGDAGLTWRLHEANLLLRSANWKTDKAAKDKIEAHLKYCIQADPNAEAPAVLLAGFYQQRSGAGAATPQDLAAAESVLRRVVERNPRASGAADRLIGLLNSQGRIDEVKSLNAALAQKGNRRSADNLAVALVAEELDDAITTLRQQVRQDPDNVDRRLLLAKLIFADSEGTAMAEVEEHLSAAQAAADDPTASVLARAEIYAAMAGVHDKAGRAEDAKASRAEALRVVDELLETHPGFAAYQWRAAFYQRQGDGEAAEQDFMRLTTLENQKPAGYLALGRFYLQRGDAAPAQEAFRAGLALAPDDVGLGISLMGVLMGSTNPAERQEGQALLERLHDAHPDNPVILMAYAADLLQSLDAQTSEADAKAKRDAATRSLETAVQAQDSLVMGHQLLIQLKLSNGDIDGAAVAADRAAAANPDDVGLALTRINVQRRINPGLARQLARRLADDHPQNADANYLLASIEFKTFRDARAALAPIRRASEAAPDSAAVVLLRAEVFSAMDNPDAAITSLRNFDRDYPDRMTAPLAAIVAELYRAKKERSEAASWLERARSLDPDDGAVFQVDLALLLTDESRPDRFDEAVVRLRQRVQSHPDDHDSFLMGAKSLMGLGPAYHEAALEQYDAAIATRPDSIGAHLGRATVAFMLDRRDEALSSFDAALALDPNNVDASNGAAWILYEKGDPASLDRALEHANRAVQLSGGTHPNALDTRGNIQFARKAWADARRDFERCVTLAGPDSCTRVKAMVRLGQCLIELDDKAAARRRLDEATAANEKLGCLDEAYKLDLTRAADAAAQ